MLQKDTDRIGYNEDTDQIASLGAVEEQSDLGLDCLPVNMVAPVSEQSSQCHYTRNLL